MAQIVEIELLEDPHGAKYFKKIMQRLNMAEARGKLGKSHEHQGRKESIKDTLTKFVGFKQDGFWQGLLITLIELIIIN